MRRIAPEIEQAFVLDWCQVGTGLPEIARRHGIGATTARKILERNGYPAIPKASFDRQTTERQDAAIVARYLKCGNSTTVGREFRISSATVVQRVREAGQPVGAKGCRPKPLTGEQVAEVLRLRAEGVGVKRIAAGLGISSPRIKRCLREHGLPVAQKRPRAELAGHSSGYITRSLTSDDPLFEMAHSRGYVMEHRYVMACAIGRPLAHDETVHHINGDRTDNRLANLQLRQGRHGKGAAFRCLDCGSHNVEAMPLH